VYLRLHQVQGWKSKPFKNAIAEAHAEAGADHNCANHGSHFRKKSPWFTVVFAGPTTNVLGASPNFPKNLRFYQGG
jgi:hypothetical protein